MSTIDPPEVNALRACLLLVEWLDYTRVMPAKAVDEKSGALWKEATRLARLAKRQYEAVNPCD